MNLIIDEGTGTLIEAAVLFDGVVVGTQQFSTGAPAEDGPAAAVRPVTIQINTAAFAAGGTVTHLNGPKVVSATATTINAAGQKSTATATNSQTLTLVNQDLLIGTVSSARSAVSGASQLWRGGDVTVGVTPVPYSGKTLGSISVTLVQDPSAPTTTVVTEVTAPFSLVFSADCEEPDELCLWQSDTADPDNLNITAAAYTNGSPFTLGTGPDPNAFSKIDGASPLPQLYDNIPPEFEPGEVFALPEAVANGTEICCDNSWMTSLFPFDDALGDTEDDDTPGAGGAPGIGGVVATFHAGAASLDDDELEALPHAATPGAAGLSSGLLNTDYEVRVGLRDGLNNVAFFGLSANGTNGIDFFGVDDTPGTHSLTGVPDMTIYNEDTGASGLGITFSSLVEDTSGFGAEPVTATMTIDPVPDALVGPYVIADEEEDGGAINLTTATPACGVLAPSAQDMGAVNCIPDGTAGATMDGVYTFDGTLFNQAGGLSTPQTVRILHDLTDPLITANVSLQPVLTGGSPATFSGAVSDNHELGSMNFTFDYGNFGDWVPYGPDALIGDGDPWDGAYTTTANPSVTVNFVAGVQVVDGVTSLPTGAMFIMTNVRTIAYDIAGNPSLPVSNNINPGTINGGTPPADYSGAGILAPGWLVTEPAAAVSICNGEDPGAGEDCEDDLGFERTVDIDVGVTGVSGFPNPFLNGRIYFYMVDPITGEFNLLADLAGNAASLTDVGGFRTYRWTYTLTLADVTGIAGGTPITIAVLGVNDDGEGLRLNDNANITVEDGL